MSGVDVYYNLHRKVWSLRSRKNGLVVAHTRIVSFPHGASLVVRAAGRKQVLLTGRKNVHAFVRGETYDTCTDVARWMEFCDGLTKAAPITYNPHRADHFTRRDTGERIDHAAAVVMIAPEGAAPRVLAVPE